MGHVTSAEWLLDEQIEAFERACEEGSGDIGRFLPPADHPQYGELLVELVRVDLELAAGMGLRRDLNDYGRRFPELRRDARQWGQVAFEDYRLRRAAGEPCTREDYQANYGVSSETWPELPLGPRSADPQMQDDCRCADAPSPLDSVECGTAAAERFPQVGERFLDFELVGELGRGAFARAYLARQQQLAQRWVVLKITPHLTEEPQQLAQLQHTNIVPIYSLHQQGNLQAVCMPFLGPNTLADLLVTFRANRALPATGKALVSTLAARQTSTVVREAGLTDAPAGLAAEPTSELPTGSDALRRLDRMSYPNAAVWIVARLASGLAHAHDHGLVHCDLKPANVLLSDDGEPLILDFNLATRSTAAGAAAAHVGGTLPYMAPEQLAALEKGTAVSPAADLYALGVILFELLTGELPFPLRRGPLTAVLAQMKEDRRAAAPNVTRLHRRIPADLALIVARCLEREPTARYTSARELQADLERHLEDLPLQHTGGEPVVSRAAKWCRRHPRITSTASVATAAVVLILALATAGMIKSRRLAQFEAAEQAHQFWDRVESSRTVLNVPGIDDATLRSAVADATKTAEEYGLLGPGGLEQHPPLQQASPEIQRQMRQQAGELLYLLGSGTALLGLRSSSPTERQRQLDEALRWNDLAASTWGSSPPQAFARQRTRLLAARDGRDAPASPPQDTVSTSFVVSSPLDSRLLAAELLQAHRDAESIAILEGVLREHPQDYASWFGLAGAYHQAGNYAEAEACLSTCLALRPQLNLARFLRGLTRLARQRWEAAATDFGEVLRVHPGQTAALVNRALAHTQLGHRELALADLSAAIAGNVAETRVYLLRARLREQTGDSAGAAADLAEGLRRTPQDELSWIARGVARLPHDPSGASNDFREALRWNPRSATALQNLAHVLAERLGRTTEAVEVLERLLTWSPADALARANRGVLLARLHRRQDALAEVAAVEQQQPVPAVVYRVACIHALLVEQDAAEKARAMQQLGRALREQPSLVRTAVRDPDLEPLRKEPEFQQLISSALLLERFASQTSLPRE